VDWIESAVTLADRPRRYLSRTLDGQERQ
jgi:hypothetical protein